MRHARFRYGRMAACSGLPAGDGDAFPTRLGQADRDGLIPILDRMFSLAGVMNLLADVFSGPC
jgi:hypothetical protein